MSHRVETAPEEEVVEVNSDDEGTIDLNSEDEGTVDLDSEDGKDGNLLPSPEEDDDELALTNREFNEQFVYHTTPPSPFPNYPSPPRLPLPNLINDSSTNNPNAPQNTTVHVNAEQLGNQQSTETGKFFFNKKSLTVMTLSDQPVAVAEIAVNGGTVVNTAATAVAVHQSTETDDQRDTDNERRRRPFRCTVCPKAFPQKCNLTVHLCKNTGERLYQCTVCPKAYACSKGLQYHRQHAQPPPPSTALTNWQFNDQFAYHITPPFAFPNYPPFPLRLPLPSGFQNISTLLNRNNQSALQNTTVHDNAEQLGNQLSPETGKFSLNKNILTKKSLTVTLSNQPVIEIAVNGGTVMSTAATAVAVHQSTETDDQRDTDNERRRRPFRCTVCTKAFTQKGHLAVHLRRHTGERPYRCDQCPIAFSQKSSLTDHIRIHTGQRPYQCDWCSMAFIQKGHLTRHLRKHTGERPFQCTVCPKAYTHSTGLQYHRQHAHPPPNPLPQLNQSQ